MPFQRADMSEPHSDTAVMSRWYSARSLLIALIFFIILAISLLVGLIFALTSRREELCLSPECIKTASVILSSMNASVDPCVDFYEYACGNWIKQHPIPDDAPSISNFENLGQDLEFALKELLEAKHIEGVDGEAVRKSKYFYQLCLNESAISATWRSAFYEVIDNFGGWPSLNHDRRNGQSQLRSIEELYGIMVAKFRADSLFKTTVQPDDKDSEKHAIVIDQPTLNLFARDFYILNETKDERLAYKTLIEDVLKLLQSNETLEENESLAMKDAEEILDFETKLANITMAEDLRHDIAEMYWKMTIAELRGNFTNFNWVVFINSLFSNVRDSDGSPITFNDNDTVVIYGVEFIRRLDKLLPQFDQRIVVNYLTWCWFFKAMLRDLPDPFALKMLKFYRSLNMMQVPKMRWHGCVTRINVLMPMATSSIYIRKHFDHEAKKQVEEMIELIMEAFVEILDTEDWLTPKTKAFAKDKVSTMNRKIGYPDYLNSSELVDREYRHYSVSEGDYYRTKFQFFEMYQKDILEKIRMKVDRDRWVAGAAIVNAFYSPNTNEIIFPAGILQPVFYDKHFPRAMNFGGIGVVIGHEITHGFDDRGRLYDKMGNIVQWWDNATIQKFEEKALCIEKQYNNYTLEQINIQINGKNTKGENIADNGGLKQAYRAYKKYEANHKSHPKLPGINLTNDQLFFFNYAQIWCGTMNDKEAVRKLRTSEHSPGPIRVKGPLSNSHDFAAAFNCPIGSPMNPEKKCRVW